MVRIAQVMAGAPVGGAELFYERLCIGLHDAGETVLPVIRRHPGRAARLREAGLQPVQLGFGSLFGLLTRGRLVGVLRRFRPDRVIGWMNRGVKSVPEGNWVLIGRLGGYYDLSHYRRCDHLVANTRGLVAWIIGQGWPAARVHHLPNFVPDLAGAKPADRAALGVPEGAKLVLALGRLHANKAFDVLIRAVARLPGVHAVIAGEGPQRIALKSLARMEGVADRVHLPGWRTDTGELLAACDVLACPSRHEPLGNVVIEAWSAGRPVVAAAAQGPAELITTGIDGVLVAPEDPKALAEALAQVLGDSYQAASLCAAGRGSYLADYAEAPVVARWRSFLATAERR
ncbi:MAG: glycosyltransferase [Acidisphaera sp.]|nr:glycosyltransferase [Acidisphaera sp.]